MTTKQRYIAYCNEKEFNEARQNIDTNATIVILNPDLPVNRDPTYKNTRTLFKILEEDPADPNVIVESAESLKKALQNFLSDSFADHKEPIIFIVNNSKEIPSVKGACKYYSAFDSGRELGTFVAGLFCKE